VYRRCHQPCTSRRDCPPGSDCQLAEAPYAVCTQGDCAGKACPQGQQCGSDNQCHAECVADGHDRPEIAARDGCLKAPLEFGDRGAFAKLLRACGEIDHLERVRFTSPHPAAFTDDVIEAMAATSNVMPQLHMPLQSGSDAILRAMRRSYRAERFLGILDRVRGAMPEAAISTDLIVGFPGETEQDFAATLDVVAASRFTQAFTFQYSPRPGTPAAALPDQVPKAVVQERYERLVALQEEISWAENRRQEGHVLEVLVAAGEGRKDEATARLSGRAHDNRLVHFALPADLAEADRPRPGDVATVAVTYGAPHHLVADGALRGEVFTVRRTRAGDAWAERQGRAVAAPRRPRTGRVALPLA